MTAMEIARFDFTELTEVAVVCKRCGARRTYPLDGEKYSVEQRCHCCGGALKDGDDITLRCLQEMVKEARSKDTRYRLEFDLTAQR